MMSDYYHDIEEELSLGMVKTDRVLKYISHQNQRIKELESKNDHAWNMVAKCDSDVIKAIFRIKELEAKLARAVDALEGAAEQHRIIAGMDLMSASAVSYNAARCAEATIAELKGEN